MRTLTKTETILAAFGLAALLGAAMVSGPVWSDPALRPTHHPFNPDPSTPMGIPLVPPANAWLNSTWTGDNRPFEAAFAELRAEGKRGGNTEATLRRIREREREVAQQHPLDLLAHVRWLFAASRVAEVNHEFDAEALESVARLDPGIYRAVARTRFVAVMASDDNGTHPVLAGIGARLVASYPQDTWLRGRYIRDLAQGEATLPRAEALSDAWVREAPESPKSHAVCACVATLQWFRSHQHNRAAAERSVAEYRNFIRLTPPTDKERANAANFIAVITKEAALTSPIR